MAIFVGIASYARPSAFRLCLLSLVRTQVIKGAIAVIDVRDEQERARYMEVIERAREYGLEVVVDLSSRRRGSTSARNKVLDMAEEVLKDDDVLILYDDDYVCPGTHAIIPAKIWLRDRGIGLVGGRVVNLRRRRMDPDIYLDILPGLADALTKLTGFIFLDTRHGPRYVDYTTPLMATRIDVVKKGVRYDLNYRGTGYREESDFQLQIRKLGYKIVHDPRFFTYHLCIEEGGNRAVNDIALRFYWKARNHAYYSVKHKMHKVRVITSTMIILGYAMIHGMHALGSALKGFRHGLRLASTM